MSNNQREALINAGIELVHARGFATTGVREIAASAGVAPGSFTNHFRSKQAFEVLVLDRYADRIDALMINSLSDKSRPASERLTAYFDQIASHAGDYGWQRGCMVPDLAGEIAAHGDALRLRLCAILAQQSTRFEELIRELQPDDAEAAADLAGFLLAAWHGTLLRMKVERSAAALDRFRRMLQSVIAQAVLNRS